MSDHRIEWTIETDYVRGEIVCEAPEGAPCRLVCAEGCGAESWPCYSLNDEGTETEHPMIDGGECMALPWFDESAETYYDGLRTRLVDGPIELEWTGDVGYDWHYVEATST